MFHDGAEGGSVPHLAIEPRRVAEVGEDNRQRADGDRLPGAERLAGEEVTEKLERRHLRRRRRLLTPGGPLEDEKLLAPRRILESKRSVRCQANLLRGPPSLGRLHSRLRDTVLGRHHRDSVPALERAHPVAPGREGEGKRAALSRTQELLGHDVGRYLRTADAVVVALDGADRSGGSKGELDRAVEVDAEVDVARRAVDSRLDIAERGCALLGASAQRAEEIPLQLEQSRPRSVKAGL